MSNSSPQFLKVGLSAIALLVLLIALASFDSLIFRDAVTYTSSAQGGLDGDKESIDRMYDMHERWRLSYIERVYEWQARSTRVIFWLSIFMSVSGVGLAFWQFVASTKEAESAAQESEMKIKSKLVSLAFKSRSIAALVLFVSMTYLALYTLLIYPVKENNGSSEGQSNQSDNSGDSESLSVSNVRADIPESVLDQANNKPPKEPK